MKYNIHFTLFLQAKLSSGNLLDVAHTIASAYLVAGSGGCKSADRRRAPSLVRFASSSSGERDDDVCVVCMSVVMVVVVSVSVVVLVVVVSVVVMMMMTMTMMMMMVLLLLLLQLQDEVSG